jgi:hypothetical protein
MNKMCPVWVYDDCVYLSYDNIITIHCEMEDNEK